jgi:uncharacterized protein (TIGR02687 family)
MTDYKQITGALDRLFHTESHRIVFWNDPEREFESTLPFITLDGVTTLRLDRVAALGVKLRLEREEPDAKFLLYSPAEEPDPQHDWLLDVRLYSECFRADRASILLQELGLLTASLREHLIQYRKFFDNRERLQKLKSLVAPNDTAADLDRKMMAVVAKAEQPELFNLVRTIFHAWTEAGGENDGELDLDNPPAIWSQIEKFDLDRPFWRMVKAAFGYDEETPSLRNLLLRLLMTDFAHHLRGELPPSLRSAVLPKNGWSNAIVCLAQWRDSTTKAASYDRLSAAAAGLLRIEDCLPAFEIEDLLGVMTFLDVEKRIASSLRERVQSTVETLNLDDVRAIVTRRQAGYWANPTVADSLDAPRQALHAVYDALAAAAEFFALRNRHLGGFDYPDASAMYRAYETELFRFDQLHRHFCESADTAEFQGWNVVKPLRADMEAHFVNWYLANLALAWGRHVAPPGGLLAKWEIDGVPNQYQFYSRHVRPWLEEGENRRAFVIVSDAFRYEAAQELAAELNGRYRFEAKLSTQLGVVPSCTPLGMASLLPHKTLAYKGADVLVDGQSSQAANRGAILRGVGGLACKAEDLMAKRKDEGREFVKDQRVVYVYHDTVDAVGDTGKTEGKTFESVRRAIDELAALVGYIVNNLNSHYVVVTADHGFLFTEMARGETDKTALSNKPLATVAENKRYLLGTDLSDSDQAWHGKTSVTARAEGGMEFWIPKGASVFHFVGGARFVHGGAMLQEIVVPVVTVKQLRGKQAQETKVRPVMVQVMGGPHRVTAANHRFQLLQMEPVSERVRPITLRVALYEGEELITDIHSVKFDSSSGNLDERKKWVPLVLKERPYNKKRPYRLVLRDADTGIEQQSVEVIIDRTFTDDF